MPKPTSSYRIPQDIMDFIKDFKDRYNYESSTDVVIHALQELRKKVNRENNLKEFELTFGKSTYNDKLGKDPNFRKKEYEIASKLTLEELQEYEELHKVDEELSLRDYCEKMDIDWTAR